MIRNYKEDNKKVDVIMSQQEVLEMYKSYFRNLPMITTNIMGEVEDVYGKFCEDYITEDELQKDKDKYIDFLLSFINFLYLELESDIANCDKQLDKYDYIFECMDGTFGEKLDTCETVEERLKLASQYGWYITPNEVFGVK